MQCGVGWGYSRIYGSGSNTANMKISLILSAGFPISLSANFITSLISTFSPKGDSNDHSRSKADWVPWKV